MAEKVDPVVEIVEEEEEEWPEAGAQNVAEAEQYQDKINHVFDTLSILIHQDTKTALLDTHSKFQKDYHKAMGQYGGSRHRRGIENHQGSDSSVFTSTFNGGASRWWTPLRKYHLARNS